MGRRCGRLGHGRGQGTARGDDRLRTARRRTARRGTERRRGASMETSPLVADPVVPPAPEPEAPRVLRPRTGDVPPAGPATRKWPTAWRFPVVAYVLPVAVTVLATLTWFTWGRFVTSGDIPP